MTEVVKVVTRPAPATRSIGIRSTLTSHGTTSASAPIP